MDNWTKQGALFYIEEQGVEEEVEVKEMILNGQWNTQRLQQLISLEMVNHIVDNISPILNEDEKEKPWWMGNSQ